MKHCVVYNGCYGLYGLSQDVIDWLEANARDEIKEKIRAIRTEVNRSPPHFANIEALIRMKTADEIPRHDPDLVRCVQTIGVSAGGVSANLCIYELKGNQYRIEEYDGKEWVVEPCDEEYITIPDHE